jgi:O-methyltransferase
MIPIDSYVENLFLARQVAKLDGCIVECGVWRGGMMAGISTVLGPDREYFLFDSFEGLPPAKEVDGSAALEWQRNTQAPDYYDNCSAGEEYARRAMTLAGARTFHLVKGWFEETLPSFAPPKPIALLRLDGDWYDSTMVCLESLFHHVIPGGLIIVDDYYAWDGCTKALHDFLSRQSAVERIRSQGEVCYLRKEQRKTHSPSQAAIQ